MPLRPPFVSIASATCDCCRRVPRRRSTLRALQADVVGDSTWRAMWTRVGSTAACQERVAVYVEGAGLLFTGCVGEGVDGRSDGHIGKSGLFEHLLPARTGQPACDSAGPEVDVA